MKKLIFSIVVLINISTAQPTQLAPPTISFQGILKDTTGNLIADGTYNMTFEIWRLFQGNQEMLWQEIKDVQVVDGLVTTVLGDVAPIIGFSPQGEKVLRIQLGDEILGQHPFTTVPFSMYTNTASFSQRSGHSAISDTSLYTLQVPGSIISSLDSLFNLTDSLYSLYEFSVDSSAYADTAGFATNADTATYALNIIGNDDSQDSTFETRFIDYTFSLSNDAEIFGVTVQELLGTSMTYGTITLLDIENFICNDCDASDSYSFFVMSYDNSYQGTSSPPNSQSIAYEYAGNTDTFYSSGYHITINPTTSLLKIRSNNHATSGTLKLLVTGLFDD